MLDQPPCPLRSGSRRLSLGVAVIQMVLLLLPSFTAARQPQTPFLKEILTGRCYQQTGSSHDDGVYPPGVFVVSMAECNPLVGSFVGALEAHLDDDLVTHVVAPHNNNDVPTSSSSPFAHLVDVLGTHTAPGKGLLWMEWSSSASWLGWKEQAAVAALWDQTVPETTRAGALLDGLVFCGIDQQHAACPGISLPNNNNHRDDEGVAFRGAQAAFWSALYVQFVQQVRDSVTLAVVVNTDEYNNDNSHNGDETTHPETRSKAWMQSTVLPFLDPAHVSRINLVVVVPERDRSNPCHFVTAFVQDHVSSGLAVQCSVVTRRSLFLDPRARTNDNNNESDDDDSCDCPTWQPASEMDCCMCISHDTEHDPETHNHQHDSETHNHQHEDDPDPDDDWDTHDHENHTHSHTSYSGQHHRYDQDDTLGNGDDVYDDPYGRSSNRRSGSSRSTQGGAAGIMHLLHMLVVAFVWMAVGAVIVIGVVLVCGSPTPRRGDNTPVAYAVIPEVPVDSIVVEDDDK